MTSTDQGQAKQHLTAPQSTRVTEITRPHNHDMKQNIATFDRSSKEKPGIWNSELFFLIYHSSKTFLGI